MSNKKIKDALAAVVRNTMMPLDQVELGLHGKFLKAVTEAIHHIKRETGYEIYTPISSLICDPESKRIYWNCDADALKLQAEAPKIQLIN